jgi:cupin fold WbuC family metalloprotein
MPDQIKIITRYTLDELTEQAVRGARKRKNLNLHDNFADPCQRLFNAVEPSSYIRPHRHLDPPKPECFMGIRGTVAVILFGGEGEIESIIALGQKSEVIAVDIPPGVWHGVVALTAGSIFFETKPGPYQQLQDKDFAPWAPPEGTIAAVDYLKELNLLVAKQLNRAGH